MNTTLAARTGSCHTGPLPPRSTPSAPKPSVPTTDRSDDTHDHVRNDRIDESGTVSLRVHGRLRPTGVGRTHRGTHTKLLTHDLEVKVIDAATGEILRECTIDVAKD